MNDEEKIIDIKDMLYRTCRRWRSTCVTGLIFLVCALLIKLPILIQYIEKVENQAFIETIGKYGGLGLIIGIALAVFFNMVSYIVSDKIYLAESLSQEGALNLIGCIPQNTEKKQNPLDRLIKKIFGIKISGEMQETLAERAAEEIWVLVSTRNLEWERIPVIALVSSCSAEITALFEAQTAKKLQKDARLVNAGNILQDARGVRMAERADFVILVEKQGCSVFKEYKETCRKLSLWKKDILGTVLIDVV